MDYGKIIQGAFSYARQGKAVLAYTLFTGAWAVLALLVLSVLISRFSIPSSILSLLQNPSNLSLAFLGVVAAIVVLALGMVAINGTVITNSTAEESLSSSWKRFSPKLWALLAVIIIMGLINGAINLVFNHLGLLIPSKTYLFVVLSLLDSLVLAFFFAFAEYAVVLENKGPLDSLRKSISMAMEKPVDVFIAILIASMVSLLLIVAVIFILILLAVPFVILMSGHWTTLGPIPWIALVLGLLILALGVFFANVVKFYIMSHAFLDLNPTVESQAVTINEKVQPPVAIPALPNKTVRKAPVENIKKSRPTKTVKKNSTKGPKSAKRGAK